MQGVEDSLYARLLAHLHVGGVIGLDDSVLIQFAGSFDEQVVDNIGLTNCTFSNLAPDSPSNNLNVAHRLDAHSMPYPNEEFDHVLGNAGLHHCSRPHQALYEMFRMARWSVLFVENQDSILMRLASALNIVQDYEEKAVRDG